MLKSFGAEFQRILIITLIVFFVGLATDNITLALLLGSLVYIAVIYHNIYKLKVWLMHEDTEPPEAKGLWGEIFDSLYHTQRRQRSQNQQLQAVVNRIQKLTSTLREGVIILDSRGHLDFWNPAAHRMLAFNSKDRGQSVINFIRHPQFVSYLEEQQYDQHIELPSPRFAAKRLQFQVTPFGNNERLIIVRDTTQLHNLEKMRQEFVANASHEMRTPLTVINGYIETLADSNVMPKWNKPLNQMLQQSNRLSVLINDLLVLSKLETTASDLNQTDIDINKLLLIIKDEATILAQDKQQTLKLECHENSQGIHILGDEKELHSALSNLVTNAIKYTQDGGEITIRLWLDKNNFYISVGDNGPGIGSRHLPHLTERFYRVDDSRNSSTGGTGLGLAIVKHVLMRHYAELKITSEVGKGSLFTCIFQLPYRD
ncbi:phosphate regulon sensor histidine kinase PhoR [Gilvimarinus polysaccharolyticus]|uniref:phosphate regulon sensor histidine kinase PhoR n=1 Tax=Gilvimarinus polysaccharolyticus TaxID=863921 RepID=UPI0006730FF8|nr:phosphate regulon sensor histidine kinase PhoR [Gilvimarinus polysaccharolyticus]